MSAGAHDDGPQEGHDPRAIQLLMALRRAGVSDLEVLSAMERTPRGHFVNPAFRELAYEDCPAPLGHGQTISAPSVVARLTSAAALERGHFVLEIGTGSGYHAAVLSRLAAQVYSVERREAFLASAHMHLRGMTVGNVTARLGEDHTPFSAEAPFDRIVVTAALPAAPDGLIALLKPGGRVVAPVGPPDAEEQRILAFVEGKAEPLDFGPTMVEPIHDGIVAAS